MTQDAQPRPLRLMPLLDLTDLPPSGPLLGLDPGTKTIGIAVADATRTIASPLETVRRKKFTLDAERVFALYDDRACVGFVIGLPINMDGSEGPRTQSVNAFAKNLLGVRDVPAAFWDERLSTAAVERTLLEADASRARRREVIDAMAASYILQGAIDRLKASA